MKREDLEWHERENVLFFISAVLKDTENDLFDQENKLLKPRNLKMINKILIAYSSHIPSTENKDNIWQVHPLSKFYELISYLLSHPEIRDQDIQAHLRSFDTSLAAIVNAYHQPQESTSTQNPIANPYQRTSMIPTWELISMKAIIFASKLLTGVREKTLPHPTNRYIRSKWEKDDFMKTIDQLMEVSLFTPRADQHPSLLPTPIKITDILSNAYLIRGNHKWERKIHIRMKRVVRSTKQYLSKLIKNEVNSAQAIFQFMYDQYAINAVQAKYGNLAEVDWLCEFMPDSLCYDGTLLDTQTP